MKVSDLVNLYGVNAVASLPRIPMSDANVFFVDSGSAKTLDADNGVAGQSWAAPFATLNFAISQCTASQGDIILLAPGHAETIEDTGTASGTTTDECVVDKIGVSIIGIGNGTLKPTFTLEGATDAAIVILAANVLIENIKVVSNLANVIAGITIDAAADGTIINKCELRDGNAAAKELVIGILVAANADDVQITNNVFSTVPSGGCASAISLAGGSDRCLISGNIAYGTYSTAALDANTAASTECNILDNIFSNIGTVACRLHASSTGNLVRNMFSGNGGTVAIALSGEDKMYCFLNYEVDEDNVNAITIPTTDAA